MIVVDLLTVASPSTHPMPPCTSAGSPRVRQPRHPRAVAAGGPRRVLGHLLPQCTRRVGTLPADSIISLISSTPLPNLLQVCSERVCSDEAATSRAPGHKAAEMGVVAAFGGSKGNGRGAGGNCWSGGGGNLNLPIYSQVENVILTPCQKLTDVWNNRC